MTLAGALSLASLCLAAVVFTLAVLRPDWLMRPWAMFRTAMLFRAPASARWPSAIGPNHCAAAACVCGRIVIPEAPTSEREEHRRSLTRGNVVSPPVSRRDIDSPWDEDAETLTSPRGAA